MSVDARTPTFADGVGEVLADHEPPPQIRCATHGRDLLEVDPTEAPGYYVCVVPGCHVSIIAE